ncbi:putative ribosomal protein S7 [Trichinella spiralis]|uniref:Uncharacterized protein n=1 Tax=Trichinella spiralis TaxID=6334 RepID=E5SRJ6_TRISP|nr:putative ribosomal protein S7 [Trichinella spiralis]KRY34525.1 hypothetical protein T01_1452 [Trichinella spiralis]
MNSLMISSALKLLKKSKGKEKALPRNDPSQRCELMTLMVLIKLAKRKQRSMLEKIGAGKSEKERRIRIFEELTDNGEELKKDKVNGEGNVNSYRVSRKMRRREIAS